MSMLAIFILHRIKPVKLKQVPVCLSMSSCFAIKSLGKMIYHLVKTKVTGHLDKKIMPHYFILKCHFTGSRIYIGHTQSVF